MQDKIEKQIEELLNISKNLGIDYFEEMKKGGIDEKTARHTLRLLLDKKLLKKTFGVNQTEYFLMEENNLTLEEARHVIKHPCLNDAENNCSYHKEHDKCVPFGCTLLNGWLYFKTSSNGKLKPNYKAWEALPKDILYINKEDNEKGKLDEKIKDFLDEY